MTIIERRQNELAQLISARRVVRIEHISAPVICIARKDIPEYDISEGESFTLYPSSDEGYAYIARDGDEGRECGCRHFEFKRECKHTCAENKRIASLYFAIKEIESNELPEMVASGDVETHIEDSIENSEFVDAPIVPNSCDICGNWTRKALCSMCSGSAAA